MAVKAKVYKNQTELGRRLGITQQRISELRKDPDWRWPGPPWTENAAKEIAFDLAGRRSANNATAAASDRTGPSDDDTIAAITKNPERRARILLVIERTAKIKLERELLAGGYVKKESIEAQDVARVYSLRARMQELPLRASLIAQKSETECATILTRWMREICDYFAAGGK